jgi:hypothetical protein
VRDAALLVAALALVAGCGRGTAPTPAAVKGALEARLESKSLSFRWVYCLRTTRSFEDRGEPHIVRYCATLEDGELVTNHERPAMRCGRRT